MDFVEGSLGIGVDATAPRRSRCTTGSYYIRGGEERMGKEYTHSPVD